MNPGIQNFIQEQLLQFDSLSEERKQILKKLSDYIYKKLSARQPVNLIYICTHNSRRSQFGQIWSHIAARHYKFDQVFTHSGGTESTTLNSNAITALKKIGFSFEKNGEDMNPKYQVSYDPAENPIVCFSKTYDDPVNPQKEFAAIMTCGEAEENCPFIPGAEIRIATRYSDPKLFDHTPKQDEQYDLRCKQIALETFYTFSLINSIKETAFDI